MSTLRKINTPKAPPAIGPYSQGVKADSFIFVSGQLPIDPKSGLLLDGSMQEKTHQVIDYLEAILKEAGSSLDQVVRCDVFLKDLKRDFSAMNEAYSKRFTSANPPARQTIQVSELPLGVDVEISCIAHLG